MDEVSINCTGLDYSLHYRIDGVLNDDVEDVQLALFCGEDCVSIYIHLCLMGMAWTLPQKQVHCPRSQ
jgi:hypothetical protein